MNLKFNTKGLDVLYYVLRKPNRIISDSSNDKTGGGGGGGGNNSTNNAFQSNFYITGRIWEEKFREGFEKLLNISTINI